MLEVPGPCRAGRNRRVWHVAQRNRLRDVGDLFFSAVFPPGPYRYYLGLLGVEPDPAVVTPQILAALTEIAARVPRS